MSHFDKVFARPWATPSRLSHEDQHKSSLDDGELGSSGLTPRKAMSKESNVTLFDERVQSSKGHGDEKTKATEEDPGASVTLRDYVNTHGFSAKNRSSLSQLVDAHTPKPHALSANEQPKASWRGDNTLHYLGDLKEKVEPCQAYLDYASGSAPRQSFRPGRREEFAACLRRVGVGIDSNDVESIRKVRILRSLQDTRRASDSFFSLTARGVGTYNARDPIWALPGLESE